MKEKWWVSPYNSVEEIRRDLNLPSRVGLHDCTLRDGEQTLGVVFRCEEKVKIARALDELGVIRIEAGFPSVSLEGKAATK